MAKAPGRAGDQSAEPDQQAQVEALWPARVPGLDALDVTPRTTGGVGGRSPRQDTPSADRFRVADAQAALAPLAAVPGTQLVSLQKVAGLEQLERCSFRPRFVTAQAEINSQLDFAAMAAVMAHLASS